MVTVRERDVETAGERDKQGHEGGRNRGADSIACIRGGKVDVADSVMINDTQQP